jgi:3-methyladenine DNA glycosylase Tag
MPVPDQIEPTKLGDYLEIMTKAVFQSGISWKVVDNKWLGIQEAFRGFDAETVAGFGEKELDDLTSDARVIRHRRKLEAILGNARRMIELDKEHGSFQKYLRSQPDFNSTVKDIKKQFKYMGLTGIYFFLYSVGEKVPPHEDIFPGRS